jgi:hypothetical protein
MEISDLPEEYMDDWDGIVKTLWFERKVLRLLFDNDMDHDFNVQYSQWKLQNEDSMKQDG